MPFNSISQYIKKYLLPYGGVLRISDTEKVGDYSLETYTPPPATPTLPSVTTTAVASIGVVTATLGGNVTSDGGSPVNEYGVVWKTSTGPTIADNRVPIGMGSGAFSKSVSGLPAGTMIYVKAYAINGKGIVYGNEVTETMLSSIISLNISSANPSDASSVQYSAIFSNNITGLTTSNFSLTTTGTISGASITSLSGSGSNYTVTVSTGTGDGTLQLKLQNNSGITPVITGTPFAGQIYLIDKSAPVATITLHPASIVNLTSATFNFTGTDTGGSGISGFLVSLDGSGYTSASSPKTYIGLSDGSHTFNVKAVDNAGNIGTPATYTWVIDTVAPYVLSINRKTPSGATVTSPSSLIYEVTFSEDVTGVNLSDFILTDTSTVIGSLSSISAVSASVYDVTVDTITGNGTMRLDLKSSGTGIQDMATNNISTGYTSGQTYTITNYGSVRVTNSLPNSVISSISGITGYAMGGTVGVGGVDNGTHSSSLSGATANIIFTGTTILDGNATVSINGSMVGYHNIASGTTGTTISISGISCSLTDSIDIDFNTGSI